MTEWKPSDGDMWWALIVTLLLATACVFHLWGGVVFWGLGDLGLTIAWASKRIEHAIKERR